MTPNTRTAARDALGPALIAAALAVVAALGLRYFFAVALPAELFADQATTRVPLPLFEAMLKTFGSAAKHLYLIGGLLAEAALTALVGVAYVAVRARITRRAPQTLSYADIPLIAVALWLLSAALLAPAIGGGFFGVNLLGGVKLTLLSQVAPNFVFALALYWQMRPRRQEGGEHAASTEPARGFSRRTLLRQGSVAAATLGGGIALWETLTSGLGALVGASPAQSSAPTLSLSDIPTHISPPPTPVYADFAPVVGQTPEVTSAANFYYVSKNLASDPTINAKDWKLTISGMVDRPYSLTYDQLRALPQVTQFHTLECISNVVGGDLMSNGVFVGVRLADALNAAGIQRGASEMIFKAADGYSDSLYLSQALDDQSLIAYQLDGQPLQPLHGFPARLLIPGLYGMKNGKWLTELSLTSHSYTGYWEQRGWSHEALVKLMSRIDTPQSGDLLQAKRTSIAGVAFSGDKGISRVDVSVDGGRTWQPATMKRPLGALSWTLWEYIWTPAAGVYTIVVRAIDLAGNVQTPWVADTLPDGASGYDAIAVTVR